MSYFTIDPDEWDTVSRTESFGNVFGLPMGTASMSWQQRPPDVFREIKEKRQREHEDAVLAEAARIQVRRQETKP